MYVLFINRSKWKRTSNTPTDYDMTPKKRRQQTDSTDDASMVSTPIKKRGHPRKHRNEVTASTDVTDTNG